MSSGQFSDADLQKSRAADKMLARRKLEKGDVFPFVRYEWPELIITDADEKIEFAKYLERSEQTDLRIDDFQYDALKAWFDQMHVGLGISGGTKLGKGLISSIAINIWYDLYRNCKIFLTAPTFDHAINTLYAEVKAWRRKMRSFKDQSSKCDVLTEGFKDVDNDTHFLKVVNPDSGEAFSGGHSEATLIVFDESSGTSDEQYANALSQARMIVGLSNPRAPSGWFYSLFPKDFTTGYKTVLTAAGPYRIMSLGIEHCLNARARKLSVPLGPQGGITIDGQFIKEGEPVPLELRKQVAPLIPGQACYYQLQKLLSSITPEEAIWRVHGVFPRENTAFMLFMPSWKEKITTDWEAKKETIQYKAVGVDVAGSTGGDYSAFAFGDHRGLKEIFVTREPNLQTLQGDLIAICAGYGMDILDGMTPVSVDVIGIGKGLADSLEAEGCMVVRVEGSRSAERDKEQYSNRRAEAYGELAEILDPRRNVEPWLLPDDEKLWEELFAHEKIYAANGRAFTLNSKRRTPKQRGTQLPDNRQPITEKIGRSPDRCDAVAYLGQAIRELPAFNGEDEIVHQFNPTIIVEKVEKLGSDKLLTFMDGSTKVYTAYEYDQIISQKLLQFSSPSKIF